MSAAQAAAAIARGLRAMRPAYDYRCVAMADGTTAVVEMALASGLGLIAPERRDPMRASSYGTGELMRAALDCGARRIVVAVGGSATNDAGAGLLAALGLRIFDARGEDRAYR